VPDDIKAKVGGFLDDALLVGRIGDDIAAMHGGGCSAKLHWWGWEAQLDEKGTAALVDLLEMQVTKLGLILAAFSAEVPVLAAIGGILSLVSAVLGADIKAGDLNGKGVNLKGYLWVGLSVHTV
jgi:hypothetical protein